MNGKHFVVIGGSHGIGLGIVNKLLANQSDVLVVSRTQGELPTNSNLKHLELDITQGILTPEQLPASIDGLVYCPGSINLGPVRGLKRDEMMADYELNVIGAVKCIQAALPGMKTAVSSSIVLFSTVAVSQGMPMHSGVSCVKGAVEGLTRSLAAEFAPSLRVNCIAPSLTDTPLAERLLANDQKRSLMAQRHPLKRVGTVDDIASMAVFLLSDQANWITGQVMAVDGGISTLRV